MEYILLCVVCALAGGMVGFGIATVYASDRIITLWDEKKKLNRELIEVMAEKQQLDEVIKNFKPTTIEIIDHSVGSDIKFGD